MENKVFWDAVKRIGFTVNDAAWYFGVSRITIYNWRMGYHPIPKGVFITLVDLYNMDHDDRRKKRLAGEIRD